VVTGIWFRTHSFQYHYRRPTAAFPLHSQGTPREHPACPAASAHQALPHPGRHRPRQAQLKAEGKDIIGLGAGEPDFDTPDFIKEAAIEAIHNGFTKYTAVDGTPALKQAIIAKFQRDNGLNYEPEEILVSVGGKQSFYNLARRCSTGDEVIIPAPYWVSYPDMVLLADGVPVIVDAGIEQGFKITPAQLEAPITPRPSWWSSTARPTRPAWPTPAELAALGEVLRRHPQVLIATDDMYEHILWAEEPFSNISTSARISTTAPSC
jgi:aspartate aminotransferase